MILLDVFIPVLSLSVDVRTKESESVGTLTDEICDLVRQKIGESEEQEGFTKDDFSLYSPLQNRILPKDRSLKDCGLMSGSRIMLL
jgi:hypothetical protein